MLLISSFLLHSGGSALVHPCHEMPRTKKTKNKNVETSPLNHNLGNIFSLFQPPNQQIQEKEKTTHLIVKQQLRTIVATSRFRWKSFVMGRFDLENFQARVEREKPWQYTGED